MGKEVLREPFKSFRQIVVKKVSSKDVELVDQILEEMSKTEHVEDARNRIVELVTKKIDKIRGR